MRPDVRLPAYETAGAAAFDLAAAADVTVEPGRVGLVPTGLVIEVPPGFFLGIFARSSTPLKRGLMVANGVGIVDSDYCGPADEVKIAVSNFTAAPVRSRPATASRKGMLLPRRVSSGRKSRELAAQSRGGFGATGE